jgi:transcriptional regulator with XRE-family HTH domain
MNIEIANRLVELRKKSGLSQEELAAKLGLSRQAVSKWERAEASPDTDNLICLAKLYNVSLDDLLDTDQSVDDIVKEQVKPEVEEASEAPHPETNEQTSSSSNGQGKSQTNFQYYKDGDDEVIIDSTGIHVTSGGESVHVGNGGIHASATADVSSDGEIHFHEAPNAKEAKRRFRYHVAQEIVSSCVSLLALIAYILLGCFYPDPYIGWGVCWLVFLLIPLATSFVEALAKRRFSVFAFPVLVAGLYVLVGMVFAIWHPTWVMFLAIPLYYTISTPIDRAIKRKERDKGLVIDIDNDDHDSQDDDNDVSEDEENATDGGNDNGQ